jgi:hypothetical protein
MFLTEPVLIEPSFLIEFVLTELMFITELVPTEPILTAPSFLTEFVFAEIDVPY